MLAILRIVLGLALLCAFAVDSWSQSQQPSANVQKNKNDSQDKSESDQQNATKNQSTVDETPIVTIKVVGPKPNAANATNQNTSKNENYPTDWPMFWATVGIGCIGLLQLVAFIAQAIYIRVSAEEMRKTTKAAEDVSKDQIAHSHQIERAYMSAGGGPQQGPTGRFQQLAGGVVAQEMGPTDWFQFDINNHGKTKGEILEYGYGWCEADKVSELPKRPVYRWVEFRDQIGPGTQSRGIKRLKIPPNKPVIFGRIGYEDIFGKRHSHGFIQNLGKPIAPPYPSYTETDPPWDVSQVGERDSRDYQEEEPQS
jgi:hypothetical protein